MQFVSVSFDFEILLLIYSGGCAKTTSEDCCKDSMNEYMQASWNSCSTYSLHSTEVNSRILINIASIVVIVAFYYSPLVLAGTTHLCRNQAGMLGEPKPWDEQEDPYRDVQI